MMRWHTLLPAMLRLRLGLALVAVVALAGCTFIRPAGISVDTLSEADAVTLATHIADLAVRQMPPKAAVRLADPADSAPDALIMAKLRDLLNERGFILADQAAPDANAAHLRFRLSAYSDGLILRVTAGETDITAMFSRAPTGALTASSPLSMRQVHDD